MGPRAVLYGCRKYRFYRDFFSCSLFIIHPYLFLCPDCPGFCLLSLLCNTQHKHPCLRRDSNPQSQQASGHRPNPRLRGHRDRQDSIPGPSSPQRVAIQTALSRPARQNVTKNNKNSGSLPLCNGAVF